MALRACKNCSREISASLDRRAKCPLCGHDDPLYKQRNFNLFMTGSTLAVVAYLFPDIFVNLYHNVFK